VQCSIVATMFIKVDALWRSEDTDNLFMKVCKEGYVMLALPSLKPMPRGDLPRPVVFHDERFVQKPSPTLALLTVLWIPIGLVRWRTPTDEHGVPRVPRPQCPRHHQGQLAPPP
jgi:hypothetical protein